MMASGNEEDHNEPDVEASASSEATDTPDDSHDDLDRRLVPSGQRDPASRSAGPDGADVAENPSSRDVDEDGRPNDVVDAELVEEAGKLLQVMMSSTGGPVPVAEDLHKYAPDERERIWRMAEAFSTDESKRRDVVSHESVVVTKREQVLKPALLIVAFGFASVTYALFDNVVLSVSFLSVPVMQVIGSTVRSSVRARQPQRSKPDD